MLLSYAIWLAILKKCIGNDLHINSLLGIIITTLGMRETASLSLLKDYVVREGLAELWHAADNSRLYSTLVTASQNLEETLKKDH